MKVLLALSLLIFSFSSFTAPFCNGSNFPCYHKGSCCEAAGDCYSPSTPSECGQVEGEENSSQFEGLNKVKRTKIKKLKKKKKVFAN